MANTFVALATVTVGSGGANTIVFSSIPQTYTDLEIKLSARSSRNAGAHSNVYIKFNTSTSGYSFRWLEVNDTNVRSTNNSTQMMNTINQDTDTASTFGNMSIYIPNYAGSNNKSLSVDGVSENNSSSTYQLGIIAGLWSNTAAITDITLNVEAGSFDFKQYSTATLYGIKNS
jgi:hypothetical protein